MSGWKSTKSGKHFKTGSKPGINSNHSNHSNNSGSQPSSIKSSNYSSSKADRLFQDQLLIGNVLDLEVNRNMGMTGKEKKESDQKILNLKRAKAKAIKEHERVLS